MITFEITRDSGLLRQYYDLREKSFREELGIPDFDGSEDESDRNGHILIARENNRFLAGARISPEPKLQGSFSRLGLAASTCCIWERFVIDPSTRSLDFTRKFFFHLIESSGSLGYHHALMLSSKRHARFYRACHSALGVAFEICCPAPEYATGPFAGLEHYLSVSYLTSHYELPMAA